MGEKLSAAQREQCHATVWDRDTYRYTGRGAHGFELHFKPRQCRRFAKANGLCHQHQHNYPEYARRERPHSERFRGCFPLSAIPIFALANPSDGAE
jgi:hypothetical protein